MMIPSNFRLRVVLAFAGMASLMLAGCGAPDEGEAGDPQDGRTLSFSNWQWLEPGRGDDLWAAVSRYTESNPSVDLERSETPFAQYANNLNTELGAGEGPDIFVIQDSQFATLVEGELLEPLDDAVADAALNSSNEDLAVDGEQLGVTWEQVPYALVGNRNVMDAAGIAELPTTVEELIAMGEAVTATGTDGFAVRHQMNESDGWYLDFDAWAYGHGGTWSDGDELTIDAPENVEALEAYKEIYDSGIMPVGDDASTFRTKFKENQLAFLIDNAGGALSFTSGGQIDGQDVVSGPLPFELPGQHQKLVLAVNANGDNVDLAKDFVSWFVSANGQKTVRPSLGASTLATDVPLPDAFAEAHPWAETFIQLGTESRSTLIPGFETDTKNIMQSVMEAVERTITLDQEPMEALEQAQQEASN